MDEMGKPKGSFYLFIFERAAELAVEPERLQVKEGVLGKRIVPERGSDLVNSPQDEEGKQPRVEGKSYS